MTDDLRERLTAALREITVPRIAGPESHMADNLAAALVPFVRAYAAEQIRRIGDEHRGGSGEVWIEDLHREAHNLDPRWEA
jgi:hypothetical protein